MHTRIRLSSSFQRHTPLLFMGAVLFCGLNDSALADVKVVTQLAVSGTPNSSEGTRPPLATPPSDAPDHNRTEAVTPDTSTGQIVTIYYKGSMARRETTGGLALLYDGSANKVYALNPAQKTYSVVATKDIYKWLNALDTSTPARSLSPVSTALPEGMRRDTKVEVDKTGLKQSLLDQDTQKYTLYAQERLSMEAPSRAGGGGMGGGRRRGGRGGRFPGSGGYPDGGNGYPGGDNGGYPGGNRSGSSSRAGRALPSTEVQGDLWLAEADVLPGGAKSPLLPLLEGTISDPTILKSVCDKIGKLKSIPLAANVTMRLSSGGPGAMGGGASGGFGRSTTTITMQVKSITEAPLEDALFRVPADYQKVKMEAVLRSSDRL